MKRSVLLGFCCELAFARTRLKFKRRPSPNGAAASGGQRPAVKRRFIFHTLARWMCFRSDSLTDLFFQIFGFCVGLGGESGAGSARWRGGGGSGCALLLVI